MESGQKITIEKEGYSVTVVENEATASDIVDTFVQCCIGLGFDKASIETAFKNSIYFEE